MPMHKVRVTQVSRVERTIVIEVEADTMEAAVDKQDESDAPSLSDDRWTITSDELQNEDVTPA